MHDESHEDQQRVNALAQAALDRPADERARWIDEVCGSDTSLRLRLTERLRRTEGDTELWRPGLAGSAGRGGGRGVGAGLGSSGRGSSDPDSGPRSAAFDADETRLSPGQQLGRYEILDLLGAGGMGRVYRALDPSLGREVAIKALAHAFRGDSGSLRRFEREARVLAALSHPNIAAIYGLERLDGAPYLVLERVEGETLAQRIARGPIPWRDAVAVALQVIEGLEEAHGKGVIHRDLKPSNVMLAPGDRAKLVDFGLAKTASLQSDTEVPSDPITQAGAVLGTARYMSPEQVRGDEVDTRTDVWAFGCLLFEMIAGRAVFAGRSVAEVLAAVLRDEPDWRLLPADTPAAIRRLLRRCLRHDPHARLQHIGDARIELLDAGDDLSPGEPASAAVSPRITRTQLWTAIGGLGAAALAALLLVPWVADAPPAPPVRLSLELPAHVAISTDYATPFAISPSGTSVVVEGTQQGTKRLFVRTLSELALRPLAGTERARQPFFSPDGGWIAFFGDLKLMKVPVDGGPVLTIADIGGNPRGAAWAADGSIVVSPSQTSGLIRIPERGGAASTLTTLDRTRGEYSHRWPDVLPGGRWALFTVAFEDASFDEARIEAVSLATGERRLILRGAGFARYLTPGQLLFVRGGRLLKAAFDPETLTLRGAGEVVIDAVRYEARNGGTHLAVSPSGVLVYTPGAPSSAEHFVSWIDRQASLRRAVETPRPFRDPRVSPDGRRIAAAVGTSTESDLWTIDANGTFSRLTFNLTPHRPAWSPDGARLTVGAQQTGVWKLLSIAADGGGTPAVLVESVNRLYPNAWSPDGRRLVYQESTAGTGWDLKMLEIDASGRAAGAPAAFAATPSHETNGAISPDGRWIAYESDELDAIVQIYVRSFPDGAHKVRTSNEGGRLPVWGAHGELYYWSTGQGQMKVARTRSDGDHLAIAAVEPVWPVPAPALARIIITAIGGSRYDYDRAGDRFLVVETSATSADDPQYSRPAVVFDWATPAPLRRRSLLDILRRRE